jgi:hypothetical protein
MSMVLSTSKTLSRWGEDQLSTPANAFAVADLESGPTTNIFLWSSSKPRRVIAAEIEKVEPVGTGGWWLRGSKCHIKAVRLFDATPAIEMQACWLAPPLSPQIVMASFRSLSD